MECAAIHSQSDPVWLVPRSSELNRPQVGIAGNRMTTLYLIRHGMTDQVGRVISGQSPGVHLNPGGRQQADKIAEYLADSGIGRIYCSPLERAQETSEPLARRLNLSVHTSPELNEIDFGDWTGRSLDELCSDPRWQHFNFFRSCTRPPGGESMHEVQVRVVNFMTRLATDGSAAALISHGDVIKAAVLHVLGMALDLFLRLEVSPGSVTEVQLGDGWVKVESLNRDCSR